MSRRFGAPLLVISEDVFPEIATELGRLTNPVVVQVLRRLVAFYLRRADHIVAIGDRMRERLIAKEPHRTVSRSFTTGSTAPRSCPGRVRTRGRVPRRSPIGSSSCTRATSGTRRTSTIWSEQRRSSGTSTIWRPIVGFGARHAEIQALAERLDADKVMFLPYQPRELLTQSLSSAHIHYVGLAKGLAGFVVPSRLYGILSAGRSVIVAADPDSETARLVADVGCGVVILPDRPDLLAAAIRDAARREVRPRGDGQPRPSLRRAGGRPAGGARAVPVARRRPRRHLTPCGFSR